MTNSRTTDLLNDLKKALEAGLVTPTNVVELDTLVCLTIDSMQGPAYFQFAYDPNNKDHERVFSRLIGRRKGENINGVKIVAVFDIWEQPTLQEVEAATTRVSSH